MTRSLAVFLAAAGSAALLAGAFAFQYIGGLAPCHLCLLQRWPHAAAVVIGMSALLITYRPLGWLLPLLGAVAAGTTAALGLYHTGVERHWWQGPNTCTAGDISAMNVGDLTDQLLANTTVVQCDQVAWAMAGLSMASWNMVVSLGLVGLWLVAAQKSR